MQLCDACNWLYGKKLRRKKYWFLHDLIRSDFYFTCSDQLIFFIRMAVLNREATKIWPGNTKVHIKANATERLKLEEFVTRMEQTCSLPDIGFGRGEQDSHLDSGKLWLATSSNFDCNHIIIEKYEFIPRSLNTCMDYDLRELIFLPCKPK